MVTITFNEKKPQTLQNYLCVALVIIMILKMEFSQQENSLRNCNLEYRGR